jgi:DNA-binding NarL/FixJ family response regulator
VSTIAVRNGVATSRKRQGQKKSRIIVVEDHPVLRDGLMQLIRGQADLACIGVADNTSDAKRLIEQCEPDLLLLDLRLKGGDALDLIKSLRVERARVKVLVLSQYDELIFAERALRAGAYGYIMKENAADEILRAVRKVLAGELFFSDRVAAALVQRTLREKPGASHVGLERLSDREMQVFQLLGASYSAREIAKQFHLSRKTVDTHCEKIKHKLSLHSSAEVKQFAQKWAAENLMPSGPWAASQSQKNRSKS